MRLPRSLVWFFFPPSMCFSSLKILLTDSYSTPFIPLYDIQKLEFQENQIDHFPYFSYGETWGKQQTMQGFAESSLLWWTLQELNHKSQDTG